jgi:hypothetical protein
MELIFILGISVLKSEIEKKAPEKQLSGAFFAGKQRRERRWFATQRITATEIFVEATSF